MIERIFSKDGAKQRPEALYLLGNISFRERNIPAALETWRQLAEKHPRSSQAALVKNRLKQLAEIVGQTPKTTVENVIAQSYLQNGDFWSEKKNEVLVIDLSGLPLVEMASKWYDLVIKEFPNSEAARLAYEEKMKTLIGWQESDTSYGIKRDFLKYMPQLINTFTEFEIDFPEAATLQGFRYQIAQVYWSNRNSDETKLWHNFVSSEFLLLQ